MKKISLTLIASLLINLISGQSIAFMRMTEPDNSSTYLNNAIIEQLKKDGLNISPYSNTQLFSGYNNSINTLKIDQIENLKLFKRDFIIIHKSEKSKQSYREICFNNSNLIQGVNWQSEFYVFDVNTNQSIVVTLVISTYDCGAKLESCSNILSFVKTVKDFIQRSVANKSTDDVLQSSSTDALPNLSVRNESAKRKSRVGPSINADGKFKVVRVKERNPGNNYPVAVDVYDKSLSLKVGDNILLTRTDEVKIPGESTTIKSETTIGKARIIEDFNKPLYTAKLIGTAVINFKNYTNGDENYTAVKGEDSKGIISVPKVMVIPEKIDPKKLTNVEYQLSNEEILIIGAFKNKLENKNYTTIGFETAIKKVYEDRLLNEQTKIDLKSLILESSGADFYVEFKSINVANQNSYTKLITFNNGANGYVTKTDELIEGRPKWVSSQGPVYKELNKSETYEKVWSMFDHVIYLYDQSNKVMYAIHDNGNGAYYRLWLNKNADYEYVGKASLTQVPLKACNQNFNFKIRNYATNEDVATDIKQLNTCGNPEDFKSFAESILNEGALNKMNAQFQDILKNGKKISVNITVLNSSSASFDKQYNGIRLEEHIQNAIQAYSLTYRQNGVVDKRMTFSEVYIPSVNENNGQNNYPNDFALSVIKYLKDVVGLDCEKTVIGQNVNINVK